MSAIDRGTVPPVPVPPELERTCEDAFERADRDEDALLDGFADLNTEGRARVLALISELRGDG